VIDIATLQGEARPSVLNTFVQGANLNYWGADLGARLDVNSSLSIFSNYAYLSVNQFESVLAGNESSGLTYYLMQPQHKVKLGVNYASAKGVSGNIGLIHNTGFDSPAGNATIQKVIKPYTVVDAGVGYNFGNGLTLNATVSNLLNQYYRALPQFVQTGRLALLKATYEFGGKKG
jgi:outer membrane receptor protein involved in Fe transport